MITLPMNLQKGQNAPSGKKTRLAETTTPHPHHNLTSPQPPLSIQQDKITEKNKNNAAKVRRIHPPLYYRSHYRFYFGPLVSDTSGDDIAAYVFCVCAIVVYGPGVLLEDAVYAGVRMGGQYPYIPAVCCEWFCAYGPCLVYRGASFSGICQGQNEYLAAGDVSVSAYIGDNTGADVPGAVLPPLCRTVWRQGVAGYPYERSIFLILPYPVSQLARHHHYFYWRTYLCLHLPADTLILGRLP